MERQASRRSLKKPSKMELSLLEISGSTAGFTPLSLQGIKEALQGTSLRNACQVYHSFRTVGENKVILVINGDVDVIVDSINSSVDGEICVVCTPLRLVENFARQLGAEGKLCLQISPDFSSIHTMFYIRATFDHPDMSTDEFYKLWKEESEVSLGLRIHGTLDYRSYKVVCSREMVVFFNSESADALDDALSQLPMFRKLGSNLNTIAKVVKPLT